jgi:hypothetical protein
VSKLKRACVILFAFGILNGPCMACSWAVGYFHQVTVMRGRIVGGSWLPFRWLRQSFGVSEATLTLYEYRWPAKIAELKKVAVIETDSHGNFDFGSTPHGHYSLQIDVKGSDRMGGLFDVEITDRVRTTKSVAIDVSPVHPDCTGGHEFIETKT